MSNTHEALTVSLNAARDVGARLAAMTIWGLEGKLDAGWRQISLKRLHFQRGVPVTQRSQRS